MGDREAGMERQLKSRNSYKSYPIKRETKAEVVLPRGIPQRKTTMDSAVSGELTTKSME